MPPLQLCRWITPVALPFARVLARVLALVLAITPVLSGCAVPFPSAPSQATAPADGESAEAILLRSVAAHGGDLRERTEDINLSMVGEWSFLVQRVQPVLTDGGYRIAAQERIRPRDGVNAVRWTGPSGVKQVLRTRDKVTVSYNGVLDADPARNQAAAMTADAFQLFHYGPSFLLWRGAQLIRLPDTSEDGHDYHRLLATIRPGFGFSEEDRIVAWIDTRTARLYRVHITLEGFETTKGAHADVTFLDYRQFGPLLLPVSFHERVRGPIAIDAHRWHLTGLDLDRGWTPAEVGGTDFTGVAAAPAGAF